MGGKEGRRGDERVKTASRGVMENGKGGRGKEGEGGREREGGKNRRKCLFSQPRLLSCFHFSYNDIITT